MMVKERDGRRRRIRVNWCTWISDMQRSIVVVVLEVERKKK